jgi:hypothetical protein
VFASVIDPALPVVRKQYTHFTRWLAGSLSLVETGILSPD